MLSNHSPSPLAFVSAAAFPVLGDRESFHILTLLGSLGSGGASAVPFCGTGHDTFGLTKSFGSALACRPPKPVAAGCPNRPVLCCCAGCCEPKLKELAGFAAPKRPPPVVPLLPNPLLLAPNPVVAVLLEPKPPPPNAPPVVAGAPVHRVLVSAFRTLSSCCM